MPRATSKLRVRKAGGNECWGVFHYPGISIATLPVRYFSAAIGGEITERHEEMKVFLTSVVRHRLMSFAKQIFLGGNMIFRGMREWILKESMSRQNQFFGWAEKWRLKSKDQ